MTGSILDAVLGSAYLFELFCNLKATRRDLKGKQAIIHIGSLLYVRRWIVSNCPQTLALLL